MLLNKRRTLALIAILSAAAAGAAAQATPKPPSAGQYADFANFARYAAANEALPAPAPGTRRVVFMGDSITDTWGRQFDTFFAGKPYVGRGISGQTTPQMLLRFTADVVDLKPAVVLLLAGINDIAGNTGPETDQQIEDNLSAMVAVAEAAHIRVVLASILPASQFPWRPGIEPAARVQHINAWIARYAATHNLVYCDYYTALATPEGAMKPDLAMDKYVHPNAAGYTVMKPIAEAAIAKALASPAP